jgi:hypothetical protein
MVFIHVLKFNHLKHHKCCFSDEDYEGNLAKMTCCGEILYEPIHMYLIQKITLQLANKNYKKNVILELVSILIFAII